MAFAQRYRVTIDGATHELRSKPADFLDAELQMSYEKIANPVERAPLQMQLRIVHSMFRRTFPDHPAAHDWPKFMEIVEDVEEVESVNPLTPTPRADTES